jgi:hypothetical protein
MATEGGCNGKKDCEVFIDGIRGRAWKVHETRKTTILISRGTIDQGYKTGTVVRFVVVELIHPCLNFKFDMCVLFTVNYFFSERRRPCRQRGAFGDRLHESQDQAGSVF